MANHNGADDWRTMGSDECKRQAGLVQVDGLVWERKDDDDGGEGAGDYWKPRGSGCPNCGDDERQQIISRPAAASSVERSLPDRVIECGACGIQWES